MEVGRIGVVGVNVTVISKQRLGQGARHELVTSLHLLVVAGFFLFLLLITLTFYRLVLVTSLHLLVVAGLFLFLLLITLTLYSKI